MNDGSQIPSFQTVLVAIERAQAKVNNAWSRARLDDARRALGVGLYSEAFRQAAESLEYSERGVIDFGSR